jgi:HTH-type transcriptional regulator/antitoxin HigA
VEVYEAKHWTIDPPDPIDAIKLRMEERGMSRFDLQKIIGASGRVSEILNRNRSLSIAMMRRLHERLDIPAESFLRAGHSAQARRKRAAHSGDRARSRPASKGLRRSANSPKAS